MNEKTDFIILSIIGIFAAAVVFFGIIAAVQKSFHSEPKAKKMTSAEMMREQREHMQEVREQQERMMENQQQKLKDFQRNLKH